MLTDIEVTKQIVQHINDNEIDVHHIQVDDTSYLMNIAINSLSVKLLEDKFEELLGTNDPYMLCIRIEPGKRSHFPTLDYFEHCVVDAIRQINNDK